MEEAHRQDRIMLEVAEAQVKYYILQIIIFHQDKTLLSLLVLGEQEVYQLLHAEVELGQFQFSIFSMPLVEVEVAVEVVQMALVMV